MATPGLWVLAPALLVLTGWGVNRLMVTMLLYPVEFTGIRPVFGWRGLVPARAEKIAHPLVANITGSIGTIRELFAALDPDRIAEHLTHTLRPRVGELIEDVILEDHPALWDKLDESQVRELTASINQELPAAIDGIMRDLDERIDSFLEVSALTQSRLVQRPHLLVKLFAEVGAPELRFVAHAGAWLGALAGFVMAGAFALTGSAWSLPVAGALALAAVNCLILAIVFYPRRPVRVGPWVIQGLFPRRQEEAAVVACRVFSRDVIGLRQLMDMIFQGPHADEMQAIIRRRVTPVIDSASAEFGAAVTPQIGTKAFERLKQRIARATVDISRVPFDDPIFNHERQVAVEHRFQDRLLELTPREFENLLRPAFADMQWMLVVGGALAGACAGFILAWPLEA